MSANIPPDEPNDPALEPGHWRDYGDSDIDIDEEELAAMIAKVEERVAKGKG